MRKREERIRLFQTLIKYSLDRIEFISLQFAVPTRGFDLHFSPFKSCVNIL